MQILCRRDDYNLIHYVKHIFGAWLSNEKNEKRHRKHLHNVDIEQSRVILISIFDVRNEITFRWRIVDEG